MTSPRSPQPDPLTPEERMPDLTPEEVTTLYALPRHGSQYEIDAAILSDRLIDRDMLNSSALYDRRILLVTLRSALASIREQWDAGYREGIEQGCSNCGANLLARKVSGPPEAVTYCDRCPHAMHLHTDDGACGGGCHD